jgi:hypothetical protein
MFFVGVSFGSDLIKNKTGKDEAITTVFSKVDLSEAQFSNQILENKIENNSDETSMEALYCRVEVGRDTYQCWFCNCKNYTKEVLRQQK